MFLNKVKIYEHEYISYLKIKAEKNLWQVTWYPVHFPRIDYAI